MELSAIIVLRDEDRLLPQAVASCRGLASEILVVAIGEEHAAAVAAAGGDLRLITMPGLDAAEAWDHALAEATHPWVLAMASSERISPALATKLPQLERNGQLKGMGGFRIHRRHWVLGRHMTSMGLSSDAPLRFFAKEGARARPGGLDEGFELPTGKPVGILQESLERSAVPGIDDFLRAADRRTREKIQRDGRELSRRKLILAWPGTWARLWLRQGGWREGLPGALWAGLQATEAFMLELRRWIASEDKDAGLEDR